ncbi:hypothetical protein PM015_18060, partial [Halorubrum ezzemoulense]|uniref:hypothetical protein n=1 Tax=Halorubrum ezzemoulense TaxID=337243 RepID=UPI00232DA2DF
EQGKQQVVRRRVDEHLEQLGGIPMGNSGQIAAEVIAQEQDVNQRLVIQDALERSGRSDLSPRTDAPQEIVRALDPGAVEAAIETFGADSRQTRPFRQSFSSGETLADQVAEANQTLEERRQLLQEDPRRFAETVDLASAAQADASIERQQQQSLAEFRAERDARTEAANAAE